MSGGKLSQFVDLSDRDDPLYPKDIDRFSDPVVDPVPPEAIYPGKGGKDVALPCFEIGLVLAGAVSAGAYSAGVLDYLFEVLDDWEVAKERDALAFGNEFAKWSVPPHALRIRVVAGASAGSVCSALIAVAAQRHFLPVRATEHNIDGPDAVRADNPFYDVWVNRLDIRPMLENGDIAAGTTLATLKSLLNSGVVRAAADSVLVLQQVDTGDRVFPKLRRYIADPLPVALSVANLDGVPFRYQFEGLEGARFATVRHADVMRFLVYSRSEPPIREKRPGGYRVVDGLPSSDLGQNPHAESWKILADAALASGAFPVAFAPLDMEKSADDYRFDLRLRGDSKADRKGSWVQDASMCAGFSTVHLDDSYRFATVDGGTMNNQPFQYARNILTGPLGKLEGEGEKAMKAMVIIDPFPAEEPDARASAVAGPPGVLGAAGKLLRAWINQARFDANDLALAADARMYSRFMLSPLRGRRSPEGKRGSTALGQEAIASGAMQGFSGFLSRGYRHHDFLLGRRNAENFLRNYFALPGDNKLFSSIWWNSRSAQEKAEHLTLTAEPGSAKDENDERLIVPPSARARVKGLDINDKRRTHPDEDQRKFFVRDTLSELSPTWPGGIQPQFNPDSILHLVEGRAEALADVAIRSLATGVPKVLRPILRRWLANKAAGPVVGQLKAAIHEHGLDNPYG